MSLHLCNVYRCNRPFVQFEKEEEKADLLFFFLLPPPPQEDTMMKEMEGAAVKIDSLSAGRLVLSCCATRVPQL